MKMDSSYNDEKALLEELFSGSRQAGSMFLNRFGGLIRAAVLSVDIRSNAVEYDDLFMDALGHLFEEKCKVLKSFKCKCKFSTYLYMVTRRFVLDKVTRENRLYSGNVYNFNIDSLFTDSTDDEEEWNFSEEQRCAFNEAFNLLDPKDALFIRMLVLEKEPVVDVMKFFGWNSENTVYARKNKIIEKLRSLSRKALQCKGIV